MKPKHVEFLMSSGSVVRFHEEPLPIDQNVGHHCWGVVVLLSIYHPGPSAQLLRAAALHDATEKLLGDPSFTSKILFPEIREFHKRLEVEASREMEISWVTEGLTQDDRRWIKWADTVEGMLWTKNLFEKFGYPIARTIYMRWWNFLQTMPLPSDYTEEARQFTVHILKEL